MNNFKLAMKDIRELFQFIWKNFELFLRRSVFPSSAFFVMLFVTYQASGLTIEQVDNFNFESSLSFLEFVVILLVLSAVSYSLKVLAQVCFDNRIKYDFDINSLLGKEEKKSFDSLRQNVWQKIKKEQRLGSTFDYDSELKGKNDQLLYQILGGILSEDTMRYATDAKEIGVVFISLMLSLLFYMIIAHNGIVLFFFLLVWYLGYQTIKTKYRSRAYRLYVNYLLS